MSRDRETTYYKLLRITQKGEHTIVLLALDHENRKHVFEINDFKRYSFIHPENLEKALEWLEKKGVREHVEIVDEGFRYLLDGEKVLTLKTFKPKILSDLKKALGSSVVHQADIPFPTAFMVWIGLEHFFKVREGALNAWNSLEDRETGVVRHKVSYMDIVPVEESEVPHGLISDGYKHKIAYVDIEVIPSLEDERSEQEQSLGILDTEKAEFPVHTVSVAFRERGGKNLEKAFVFTIDPAIKRFFEEKRKNQIQHSVYGFKARLVFVENEKQLFKALNRVLGGEPTTVVFWNASFDVPYLENRAKKIGQPLTFLQENIVLDQMVAFSAFQAVDSYQKLKTTFDFVKKFRSEEYSKLPEQLKTSLGEKYVRFRKTQSGLGAIQDLKQKRYAEFVFYALSDVLDMWALDEVSGLDGFLDMAENFGLAEPADIFYHSSKLDPLHLRFCMKHKVASPSKQKDRKEEVVMGAIVFEPKSGLRENVLVLDISHYYPSIIISKNLSPEHPPNSNTPPLFNGNYMLPELMKKTLQKRFHYEKLRDQAENPVLRDRYAKIARSAKYATSGEWGYIASERNRYYAPHVKRVILEESRKVIRMIAEKAQEMGLELMGGDTDSIFVHVPDPSPERFEEIEGEINAMLKRYCEENDYSYLIQLKTEKFGSRVLFTTKKRYAMLLTWKRGDGAIKPLKEGKIMVKGLDLIRADSPVISKEIQQEILELLLRENVSTAINYLKKKHSELLKKINEVKKTGLRTQEALEFIEKIAFPVHFKDSLESYEDGSYKYLALSAKKWNEKHPDDPIVERTKAFMVYVSFAKNPAYDGLDRVVFLHASGVDWEGIEIDFDKHIEKAVIQKASLILEYVGYPASKLQGMLNSTIAVSTLF